LLLCKFGLTGQKGPLQPSDGLRWAMLQTYDLLGSDLAESLFCQ
jgi:hypothetical protein